MGGWGGSVLAMIQSLKNNKMLLRGRRRFFKREMSYTELREYYKDSTSPIPNGKTPTKEELLKIRNQLIQERKKLNFFRISITWLFTICFLVFCNYSYNNFTIIKTLFIQPKKSINYDLIELERINSFDEKLARGMTQFKNKDYFLAIGNFENALRYNHSDSLTNHYLALCYYRLCKYKKQMCNKAQSHSESMLLAHPDSKQYQKLKAYYKRKLK